MTKYRKIESNKNHIEKIMHPVGGHIWWLQTFYKYKLLKHDT